MPYARKDWITGETIAEAALDNLEAGVTEALGRGFRQGVVAGKTSSGAAAFLQNDTTSISIDASTTDPLVVSFAAGFDTAGTSVDHRKAYTADAASVWSSLTASSTLYLYLNHDGTSTVTGGFSTLAPKYQTEEPVVFSADVATSGGAFVDSTLAGAAGNIFANDGTSTTWISNTAGASSSGNAFFGCDLSAAYNIGRVTLNNGTADTTGRYVTSVKIQYSATGTSGPWTDAQTFSGLVGGANTLTLTTPVSARYWRFLANSATNDSNGWQANEAELIPVGPETGQHWFDLNVFKMKRYDGSAWVATNRVFVGECVTNGSSEVTSLTPYAILGVYAPGRTTASASTATTKNHNVGTDNVVAICHQATSTGGSLTPCALTGLTAKTVSFTTAASVVEVVPVVRRAF